MTPYHRCRPYGDPSGCDAVIKASPSENQNDLDKRASDDGWTIGIWNGNAENVCKKHEHTVFDGLPIHIES